MKKYIYTIILLSSGLFISCNDGIDGKLDGIEDVERPKEVGHYEHTIVDADINEIVKALRAEGTDESKALADKLNKEKQFSEELDPVTLIPYMLPTFLKSPDVGASVDVTYTYNSGRTAKLSSMSENAYVVSSEDYATVWKNPSVDAFTPKNSPATHLPTILKTHLGEKEEGAYANVNYFYSEEEPYPADVKGEDHMAEDFSDYSVAFDPVNKNGWFTKDLLGKRAWQVKTYSDNWYAEASSNKSNEENDFWMVSPLVDLSKAVNPRFTFDIKSAYYNADCLSIWISTEFDGNQDNLDPSKWKEITKSFSIPKDLKWPNDFSSAGSADLKDYKGKKVYVAFRYQGNGIAGVTAKTTSYQIDNITIHENIPGIEVAKKTLVHDLYVMKGDKWTKETEKTILVLQPKDYDAMGKDFLTLTNAPEYLDNYLLLNYPFAEVGEIKTIVYRTSADGVKCYADEYSLSKDTGGKTWTPNSFKEVKTDQFIFAASRKWIFDPTFVITLQKGKTDTDGYMMVVNHVKANQAVETPSLINKYGDTEYYYGFNANYGNITYRSVDRQNDPSYVALTDDKAKRDLMNRRTEEGLGIFLTLQYPNATPLTNGVEQEAKVTVTVFKDPEIAADNTIWTYQFKCVGDKKWEFVQRVSSDGAIEKAGTY